MRDGLWEWLKEKGIPTMIYYPKSMSGQTAFKGLDCIKVDMPAARDLCERVLALPMHPYITEKEQSVIVKEIKLFIQSRSKV